MNSNKRTENIKILKHTMNRYDHYYDSVNSKGGLYLALNTFLFSGMVTGFFTIKESVIGRCDILFFV